MLRNAGAREVHLRICSPPTTGPCLYGTDTPERREFLASSQNTEQIQAFVDADFLWYLSEEGMLSCLATQPSTSAPRASPAAIGFWTVTAPPR